MAKLPAVNGRRVVQALRHAGFTVERIVGSHHVMVPVHSGRDLKPGTLRAIIRQAGFTLDEFTELL